MSVATAEPSAPPAAHALTAQQEAFVRAELIRRLFEGSAQSRYFSFVLWPVIAAIYWRQIDLHRARAARSRPMSPSRSASTSCAATSTAPIRPTRR